MLGLQAFFVEGNVAFYVVSEVIRRLFVVDKMRLSFFLFTVRDFLAVQVFIDAIIV